RRRLATVVAQLAEPDIRDPELIDAVDVERGEVVRGGRIGEDAPLEVDVAAGHRGERGIARVDDRMVDPEVAVRQLREAGRDDRGVLERDPAAPLLDDERRRVLDEGRVDDPRVDLDPRPTVDARAAPV